MVQTKVQAKIWREKNKEDILQKAKEFRKSEFGKMCSKINDWKGFGLLMNEYEDYITIYYHWLCSTNCEKCNIEFTKSNFKCMDHNHDNGLYRNILCHRCNLQIKEKYKNNTSGNTNIYYRKDTNKYFYLKHINKKRIYKSFETEEEAIAFKMNNKI